MIKVIQLFRAVPAVSPNMPNHEVLGVQYSEEFPCVFLLAVTKYLARSNLKGKGFSMACSWRKYLQGGPERYGRQQEQEAFIYSLEAEGDEI